MASACDITVTLFVWFVTAFLTLSLGNAVAGYFGIPSSDGLNGPGQPDPWYHITSFTRWATTAGDSLSILLMFALGEQYRQSVTLKRSGGLMSDSRATTVASGSTSNVYAAIWCGFGFCVRMGDTFAAEDGKTDAATFYYPLLVFAACRVGAFLLGLFPFMFSGGPSLSMCTLFGLIFAIRRRSRRLSQEPRLAQSNSQCDSYAAGAGSVMRDVCGYGFCCCLMALWDSEEVDARRGLKMTSVFRLQPVGELVGVVDDTAQ